MSTADTQALMGVQHRADGHPALKDGGKSLSRMPAVNVTGGKC